jgi:hypothetical protein
VIFDAVRASLDENAHDLAAVNEAFLCACRIQHEAVASLLLERSIALDPGQELVWGRAALDPRLSSWLRSDWHNRSQLSRSPATNPSGCEDVAAPFHRGLTACATVLQRLEF